MYFSGKKSISQVNLKQIKSNFIFISCYTFLNILEN